MNDEKTSLIDRDRKNVNAIATSESEIKSKSLWKTWLRITVGFVGCTLASGVLTAYPALTGLFIQHGVFDEGALRLRGIER